jgi:hypothetical protein
VKVGDLVKMKEIMWWRLADRKDFTKEVALVTEIDYNCLQLLFPDSVIKRNLAEHWEVVNGS